MKHLTIEYVAMLRERAGRSEESIIIEAETASDVYTEICRRYGFSLPQSSLRVAINDRICQWRDQVQSGDRLLFLPPSSGG